jgi:RalBP1-associated Eps domain-containing protein
VTTIRLDSNPPPAPQPRSTLTSTLLGSSSSGSQRSSAFEVYRKPSKSRNSQSPPPPPVPEASKVHEYEKEVLAISDSLRQVRFRNASEQSAHDILKHLKDQNVLLMRLCKDLSDELTSVQRKKEEIRSKLDPNQQK